MVSGKEQYVCRLMKAKCSCGSKDFSQFLNLKKDHGVLFNDNDHPLMNANDHVSGENIYTFGRCKSLCNPHGMLGSALLGPVGIIGKSLIGCKCEPLTPFPWVQVDENYYIDGAPALTINSVLHCAYGGEITITLETEDDGKDSTEETQEEEEIDKKDQLPSEVQEKIDSFCDDTPSNMQSMGEAALQEAILSGEQDAEVVVNESLLNNVLLTSKALLCGDMENAKKYADNLVAYGKAYIPQNLDNKTLLDAYDLLGKMGNISEQTIQENAAANKWELANGHYLPEEGEHIESQADWKNVRFGSSTNSNMAYSGCGIIASYNALTALGEPQSADRMVNLISSYEKEGAAAKGEFGVAPRAIASYFTKEGYDVELSDTTDAEVINQIGQRNDVIVATVYNNQIDITDMLHTVCITKTEKGTYIAHNIGGVAQEKQTLEEAIRCIGSDSSPISVIGVSKP